MYEYEDDDQDVEFGETVGLNEEDMRVTHRAAFMTLIPAWDGRLTAEENGIAPEQYLAESQAEMETAFQFYKESMATLAMMSD